MYLIVAPLLLSAFTHLWNPVGFPDFFYDEGVYMRRALHVLQGLGPQESSYYDHPHFGQLFLAGALAATGYGSFIDSRDGSGADGGLPSMEELYTAPRLLMGALAVLDTFFVFKIAEKRYNGRVALLAALVFAVMPSTWFLRRILLDSILLPFLLSSILVALHLKSGNSKYPLLLASASGVLLGLAMFTKIPVFVMIPLAGFLVAGSAAGSRERIKRLAAFLAPALLLPMIWPLYSVAAGEFDSWAHYVIWQTQRQSGGIVDIAKYLMDIDPFILVAGAAGVAYSIWRRDLFMVLWAVPFAAFLSLIGYVQYFHWISLLPVFSIASARLALDVLEKVGRPRVKDAAYLSAAGAIAVFGTLSTAALVTTDMTSAQSAALAFASDYLRQNEGGRDVTTLSSPVYSWVLRDMYGYENVLDDFRAALFQPIGTGRVLLVVDIHFLVEAEDGQRLQELYEQTSAISTFEGSADDYDTRRYPFTSLIANREGVAIEIRAK